MPLEIWSLELEDSPHELRPKHTSMALSPSSEGVRTDQLDCVGDTIARSADKTRPIGVLIVSQNVLFSAGLDALLSRDDSILVHGTAEEVGEALERLQQNPVEVALVDACESNPSTTIRVLADRDPNLKILALGVSDVQSNVIDLVEAGALGVISRRASLDETLEAIRSVAKGEAVVSPRATATLIRRLNLLAADLTVESAQSHLTARELEVLELLARDLSNKEIAELLTLEVATVKNHVHSILQKLNLHRRAQATTWLRQHTSQQ
jgi:DNA-binding NarL/FixJ family response regulator